MVGGCTNSLWRKSWLSSKRFRDQYNLRRTHCRPSPAFVLKTNLDILAEGSRLILIVWFVWTAKTNWILPRQSCQDKLAFSEIICQDKLTCIKTIFRDNLDIKKTILSWIFIQPVDCLFWLKFYFG